MTATADFRVGQAVVYRPHPSAERERGVVTSVNEDYVFVQYDGYYSVPKATRPEDLEPLR